MIEIWHIMTERQPAEKCYFQIKGILNRTPLKVWMRVYKYWSERTWNLYYASDTCLFLYSKRDHRRTEGLILGQPVMDLRVRYSFLLGFQQLVFNTK